MLKLFALAAIFAQLQAPTGFIAGKVVMPAQQMISAPVQVILLSPRYSDLWSNDVQKRLDVYWERYKPAFAAQKEMFFEISRLAHWEATASIITKMRRDVSDISEFLKEATPEGKFEFKDVPFGEYKVLALGKAGSQDVLWHGSIEIRSPLPHFLELKKSLP